MNLNTPTNIYQQYTYNYPHKHSYRPLEKPISLNETWDKVDRSNLYAYLHIPFCAMRCGFCNLFTIANPKEGVGSYLEALKREAETYKKNLSDIHFEEYAIGGGTPTFLSEAELERMLFLFKNTLGVDTQNKYGSIEASPNTLSTEKLSIIEDYGVDRISMGVQSWLESETKLLGRPQNPVTVSATVEKIKASKVPEFNLDLIYGIHSQTKKSWLYSLQKTAEYQPTEIFLYPLYTRPLTGLSKMQQETKDNRLDLYRIGRDFLRKQGYTQQSMRCFRKEKADAITNNYKNTVDGMIGIGAGARSYTSDLHYSTNYAVSRKATKAIIHAYSEKQDFNMIEYGIYLEKEEQMRRFLVKSLLDGGRLNPEEFQGQFSQNVTSLELINRLFDKNWLEEKEGSYQLSEHGMELEDYIGPMFFTNKVKDLMSSFELS